MRNSRQARLWGTMGILVVIFMLQGCATGIGRSWSHSSIERAVKGSLEPKDHRHAASAYRQEADRLREMAAEHAGMAEEMRSKRSSRSDVWGAGTYDWWITHCDRLSQKYTEAADESDALAERHEGHAESLEDK